MTVGLLWRPGVPLDTWEKWVIQAELAHNKGNKSATASVLRIAVRTLDAKLEKYSKEEAAKKQADDEARARRDEYMLRARGQHPDQQAALAAAKAGKPVAAPKVEGADAAPTR
jgi:hypothetical protein